jgi:hypothetical protein
MEGVKISWGGERLVGIGETDLCCCWSNGSISG